MKTGRVYLVGAGPGDPGLITQKGMECLSRAEVVVYDHLLDERLLDAVPVGCERVYAGKSASKHAMEQGEINQLLVEKAKQGKVVVRLKGGDPLVFGRGGEEAEALHDNGLPFEIVPGISSAIAVPAYAGVPVTHRGLASSFAVVTGHEDPRKVDSSINWEKLATATDTIVFLMGMENLAEITARLIENGRPANTPVAVVKNGTRLDQQTACGTLDNIVSRVKEAGLSHPAVIVVGPVAAMRDKLKWFDNRPLFGKRILVTRAREQASALTKLLAERGASAVELPAIEIHDLDAYDELDEALSRLGEFQWVVFTSVNAVAVFFRRLNNAGLDSRALKGIKLMSIGPATHASLREHGVIGDYCPEVYTAAGILGSIERIGIAGQRFLLPRANIADRELSDGIMRLGGIVEDVVAYRTTPAANISKIKDILAGGGVDVVTFASSSTVTNLVAALGDQTPLLKGVKIACIGPRTAETAARAGIVVDIVAPEHTIPGLVTSIEAYFEDPVPNRRL